MTQSNESKPFAVPTIEEIFALLSALNPAENGVKVVDQAKQSIESVVTSLQLILQSMENFNRVANRVDKLLDEIEGPIQKLADASTLLAELASNLAPLMDALPKKEK